MNEIRAHAFKRDQDDFLHRATPRNLGTKYEGQNSAPPYSSKTSGWYVGLVFNSKKT